MLITKLEIKGFKSFGDKVVINFDEGVTGIVGQNGCGKSNVVDAIRWVLGEQKTKALRSDKMENIIFNGTKKRKPLQMAEVSLTFKNTKNIIATEYSEVTITRRLYRSGDSEYLLNGVTCRLKDITNLFLDTGIGSDSYAIIELKMVDEILNDKENSRRNLFEEAAGIAKFKVRKRETLKKLEDADQDLARVEDLLFEINKQLASLEKQAKRTEKYYKTREEYKQASVRWAVKSVQEKQDLFNNIAQKIQQEQDTRLSLQNQVLEKEASSEKEKAELILKEKTLQSRQKSLNEFIHQIRQLESERKIRGERHKMLLEKKETLAEQITQDHQRELEARQQILRLEQERASAERIAKEAWLELETLQVVFEEQKQKTSLLQEKTHASAQEHARLQQSFFDGRKYLEIKQSQLSGLKLELEKSIGQDEERNQTLTQYEDQLEQVTDTLHQVRSELEGLEAEEADIQNQILALTDEIDAVKEKGITLNRQLDAKQNEYNLTKSLVENLEGFPEAIKYLKKHPEFNENALLLSDIFSCPEMYKGAIEGFLENLLSFYIVESEQDALKGVDLLFKDKKGRAHFFVLESFKNYQAVSYSLPSGAIWALDVLEFEQKYAPLLSFIFNGVCLVEGPDMANLQASRGVTLLSYTGHLIKRPFGLSGGASGAFEGKRIGRAKNLSLLEEQIAELQQQSEEIRADFEAKQSDLQELKNSLQKDRIREVQVYLNKINEQFISLRTKTEQTRSLINNTSHHRDELEEKINNLREEIDLLLPETNSLEQVLQENKISLETLNLQLAKEAELQAQHSGAYNQQNLKYHQQQNRVNALEQEIKFNENTLENLEQRISKNKRETENVTTELEGLEELTDTASEELIQMYTQKEAMEKGLNEAEKEYYKARGLIDTLEKEARDLQRKRELSDGLVAELQNKINETKLGFTSLKERLSIEFNVNLEEVLNAEDLQVPQETQEELQKEVQRLKNVLDTIGPINPMAMEAYNEIKERHHFITTQRDDLLTAKKTLLDTIAEIDQVARENFLTTFEAIRLNFQKVFRSLFTEEDTCDLLLVQSDNPLESPIDIIAKPKGKRPLTINQLSGGEKTLTATSLLFAIYLIKPAPFCIFDEVDAPLDDANVDKFNKIIRKFSEQSQFIIVTHNKRTMTATDVMYGVTMFPEDPGVSKLVPVDLRGLVEAS